MTYTEQDKKLIEEFQNFADSIVWSNDDGSEKYIGVGNMADWWLDKIHQALAEERAGMRCNLPEIRVSSLSLLLDDCPNCGQVVNRSFVDNLTCRIQDEYKQKILASLDKPLTDKQN